MLIFFFDLEGFLDLDKVPSEMFGHFTMYPSSLHDNSKWTRFVYVFGSITSIYQFL